MSQPPPKVRRAPPRLRNDRRQISGPAPRARRLAVEPLEPRELLATIAVPVNAGVFDSASAAPHAEVPNLLAELSAQGHTPVAFSDLSAAGISSALSGAHAVMIPEQELASLNAVLSAEAKDVLRAYVNAGHGLIVSGSPSGRAESLLNGLFGFGLVADSTLGAYLLNSTQSSGTAFAGGPGSVNNRITSGTAFTISSLPSGSQSIYASGSAACVGLIPYGQGQVVYYGYDFDDPNSQPRSVPWRAVLGLAIEQVAVATATTSVEIVAGDLVIRDLAGANDAFSLTADEDTWTITLQSGAFAAAASIPGITVGDKTVAIEKDLVTSFTGRFVFEGNEGDDVLHVALDHLDRGLHFDGGENTGDVDTLELAATNFLATLTSLPELGSSGALDLGSDGSAEITYAGVEPVDLTGISTGKLRFLIPANFGDGQLIDYLAPNDGLSQLRLDGEGPEALLFRHPTSQLTVFTAGSSLVTLFPLDSTVPVPQLLLDGDASDLFLFGATTGIRGSTSLTLNGATLDLNGQSPSIDGLSGTGAITNGASTNSVLTIGAQGGSGAFDGVISDGWLIGSSPAATRQVSLVKSGGGTQRFTSLQAYSGETRVTAGTLLLDGATSVHSAVNVQDGATLAGTGGIQGPLSAESGSTLSPGSPGNQTGTLSGSAETWQSGSHIVIQLGGTDPGGEFDRHQVDGQLTIAGALLEVSLVGGFEPGAQSQEFVIVNNLSGLPISGTFAGLDEGAEVAIAGSSAPLFITYEGGDGNDVALVTIVNDTRIEGTADDDTIIVRRQEGAADGDLEYSLNGAPFVPLNGVDSLSIDAGFGADVILLDFVHGDPVPPGGMQVDGGGVFTASPEDRLVLLGRHDGTGAIYRPAGPAGEPGTVELSGGGEGTILLAGLEAIDLTGLSTVVLNTQSTPSILEIADAADAGTGMQAALRISGASGGVSIVPLHVWSIGSLTIDLSFGGGNDSVEIASAVGNHGVGGLSVFTGSGDDTLTIEGIAHFSGNIELVSGETRIAGPLSSCGSIDVTSRGWLQISASVLAQGPISLTTLDEPGASADLLIDALISSMSAGLSLRSADDVVVHAPLSAATTIEIAVDATNTDPGEGNALVIEAPIFAAGGTAITAGADADRFEISSQSASELSIAGNSPEARAGGGPAQNAAGGDVSGDLLILDMTTTGGGESVLGPVVVDSVGGLVTSANTQPIRYREIEDLDLHDGASLTTASQGDFYVRGTDLDETIVVNSDGRSDPSFRIAVGSRSFPENGGYFGPYGRGRTLIVQARGGRDNVQMGSTPLRAEFYGGAGDDQITGGAFGDLLVGGPGRDTLMGGSQGGNDELWGDDFDPMPKNNRGEPLANPTAADLAANRTYYSMRFSPTDGPDRLTTMGGQDQVYGQGGDDVMNAGAGADYLCGGSGNDRLSGGDGDDRMYGNEGNDTMVGDSGADFISGGGGNDMLSGSLGNDVLIGCDGADDLKGNEGDDLLVAGIATRGSAATDSAAAGVANDQAMLMLLMEWSTRGRVTGLTVQDDRDMDWLYGHAGRERFVGDKSCRNLDFVAGVDVAV